MREQMARVERAPPPALSPSPQKPEVPRRCHPDRSEGPWFRRHPHHPRVPHPSLPLRRVGRANAERLPQPHAAPATATPVPSPKLFASPPSPLSSPQVPPPFPPP